MKAIVLAGGFGTRIQPLTNSMPKPMLPILNRPMMEHIIIKLRDELGIKEIAILLYFKPEIIKDYFGDGSDFGVKIQYVQPDDDYGTAGAVAFAREFLDETFIIVSGDLVTNFDFKKISKFHKEKKSKLTITLTSVENPLQFGVVIANEEHKIEKFLEKPSWGEVFSDTINTGIYLIEPEILNYIPHGKNFDFAKDLFPKLMAENITLWGCSVEGYWRDVGNPQSYREVYQDIFSGLIKLPFKGEMKKVDKGIMYLEEGVKLPKQLRVNGVVALGKNVKIADGVTLSNTSIGDNSKVSKHTELSGSVLWNSVSIGTKSKIENSIICDNNIISDEVKAPLGVIVAQNCEIAKKVNFIKDVVVWPDKIISESSVVSSSVIWGTKYKSSIFEDGKVIGRVNIELSCDVSVRLAESFGSILPIGSVVYTSRDYDKSSRMLKRAFLSGILSTGVSVIDLQDLPSNIMRHCLANHSNIAAGIHFRQSVSDPMNTEIVLYTSDGLNVDSKLAKSIEKVFFAENFRRVNYTEIGEITQESGLRERYMDAVIKQLDTSLFKSNEIKVASDIMFGSTANIYPRIMNELGVEHVVLNAYNDDKSLSQVANLVSKSQKDMENIVKAMNLDCGFLIYPNGHKMQLIDDNGELVYDYIALLAVLHVMDITATSRQKIFLPAWAPDCIVYNNLDITYGKFDAMHSKELREFNLIATTDGHFAFSEFGLNRDAVFASFKILELITKSGLNLSKILSEVPIFAYKGENIDCPSQYKGKMMRKFLEDAKGKKSTSIDGVKIWESEDEWILMVPDEYSDYLNIYIQAQDARNAERIFWRYQDKIEKWISE
ncbi:MAG: sugar phosphate nucleotidyltransferase [Campylobacterota bacterium]|nr:sugar phosphate nucleotidyltransferase [Campylobacterota bacterium]